MKAKHKNDFESILAVDERMTFEEITGPLSPRGVAFAHRMLRDSLESIRKSFIEYKVIPFSIKPLSTEKPTSQHFKLEYDVKRRYGNKEFTHGRPWWAYRFGYSEKMPPNDVPNVSIIMQPTELDITLNAELQASQKVLLGRIQESTSKFDKLLADHGRLWLKTYLKYEHQPRIYHWILAEMKPPKEFNGDAIRRIREEHEKEFEKERNYWIKYIKIENRELTERQIRHLEARNKRLNLAIRLVEPFKKSASFWSLFYKKQVLEIVGAVQRMKPLVDFFVM